MPDNDLAQALQQAIALGRLALLTGLLAVAAVSFAVVALGSFRRVSGASSTLRAGRSAIPVPSRSRIASR